MRRNKLLNKIKYVKDFFNLAQEYLKASKTLNKQFPDPDLNKVNSIDELRKLKYPLLNVRAFLLGHALELALKSFLLNSGISLDDIRNKFGHDILKCYDSAREKGLNIFEANKEIENINLRLTISELSSGYCKKALEYHIKSNYFVPLPSYFEAKVDTIFEKIGTKIKENTYEGGNL